MVSKTTQHIKVSVTVQYHPEHYNPMIAEKYVFAYHISIENIGAQTVQLLRRHWYIFDSLGAHHEVEGEGVIGQQPIIEPGKSHRYVSWCALQSELGSMHGSYQMTTPEGDAFEVTIPLFKLIVPHKMN